MGGFSKVIYGDSSVLYMRPIKTATKPNGGTVQESINTNTLITGYTNIVASNLDSSLAYTNATIDADGKITGFLGWPYYINTTGYSDGIQIGYDTIDATNKRVVVVMDILSDGSFRIHQTGSRTNNDTKVMYGNAIFLPFPEKINYKGCGMVKYMGSSGFQSVNPLKTSEDDLWQPAIVLPYGIIMHYPNPSIYKRVGGSDDNPTMYPFSADYTFCVVC